MLTWTVYYKDKTSHKYDPNIPEKFNIAHIDPGKLDHLVLKDPSKLVPVFILHIDEKGKRPIYVLRRELPTATRPYETRCHIIGWQMNVNGKNVQSINYVFETVGRKEMVEDSARPGDKTAAIEVIKDYCWIEAAGPFDRSRDSWFKRPSDKQFAILGSKANEIK
ncbi:hypothetical protein LCGC14_1053790 [marine sediment metagenome]|uniref:Uncharacterized protein n=1 Tax=marine sediment metagenome TaxID=412755 RepID=A0A0F9MSK8_9ZZZZ